MEFTKRWLFIMYEIMHTFIHAYNLLMSQIEVETYDKIYKIKY